MAKYRVVREERANGEVFYYPEKKVLGLLWFRYRVCDIAYGYRHPSAAWAHINESIRARGAEKAKAKAAKVIKREVV